MTGFRRYLWVTQRNGGKYVAGRWVPDDRLGPAVRHTRRGLEVDVIADAEMPGPRQRGPDGSAGLHDRGKSGMPRR
jgi:hypothetical protein